MPGQLRFAFGLALGGAAGLAASIALQARSAPPRAPRTITADTVRAQTFELTGPDGKLRAALRSNVPEGASLDLLGDDQMPRAQLALLPDGRALLQLSDEQQHPRLVAQVYKDGSPAVMVLGKSNARIDLKFDDDARPWLTMQPADSGQAVQLGIMGDKPATYKQATFALMDGDGKRRIDMAVSSGERGSANLDLVGSDPFSHADIQCRDGRMPSVTLERDNGRRQIYLGDGTPDTHLGVMLKNGDTFKGLLAP